MNKRIRNKLRKESIIAVDICTIPSNLDIDEWYMFVNKHGLIFWDSSHGIEPKIYPKKNTKLFRVIVRNFEFKKF